MFEKILFPTDFSKKALTELSCITSIPGIREIILLHVIRQPAASRVAVAIEPLAVQTSEVYLQKAKIYIAALNPDIDVTLDRTSSTDIPGAILEKAEEHGADLVVIHANIKVIMADVLLGSVHSQVLCRISNINVMVMPSQLLGTLKGKTYEKFCPMIFSRVLCPTNFSDLSVKTAVLAGSITGVGEIILLHVVQTGEAGKNLKESEKTAEIQINAVSTRLTKKGIRARTIVVTGKPESEIPLVAQEEDVSLIWMRSAAKGCLHDFFFGSMVHDVVMNAKRPVIIIRSYE